MRTRYTLRDVDELPKNKAGNPRSEVDQLLREFVESGSPVKRIEGFSNEKEMVGLYNVLKAREQRGVSNVNGVEVKVVRRGDAIYLRRV